jgi:hypothetical protein
MTELTAEKIRLVMLAIQALRAVGKIGATEPVSTERMARYSVMLGVPLDEKTFRNAERDQLRKARLAADAFLSAPTNQP